jgi:hypothetical protein
MNRCYQEKWSSLEGARRRHSWTVLSGDASMGSSHQVKDRPYRLQKAAAACGMLFPAVFGGVVAYLTYTELDFLPLLGWNPLTNPTQDWPSGLALGPGGWLMQLGFGLSGLLLGGFAWGMRRAFRGSHTGRWAGALMIASGAAMICLVAPTDPTLSAAPPTWHGILHDTAFVLLGLCLLPAIILWGRLFRRQPDWRSLSAFSWLVAGLALPYFVLKGIMVYPFLAGILAWSETAAMVLWKKG